MRITGYTPTSNVSGRGAKKRAGGDNARFDVSSGDKAAATGGAATGGAISGLDAILALQAVDDPLTGRRKAVQHGHDLLDGMEALKADLLTGAVSTDRLVRIMGTLEARGDSGDPDLERVIDEIELRARVELAKLGRFAA